jgi:Ca-activated chloride channel family protein
MTQRPGESTMKAIRNRTFAPNESRRGAMMVLVAVCLPVVLILCAFAVDVAYIQLTRTELRTATDAAARAGGRVLSLTQDPSAARAAAIEAASRNKVGQKPLAIGDAEIQFGRSSRPGGVGRYVFDDAVPPEKVNSLRVTGLRTAGSLSGPIPLMFGAMPGHANFEPVKTAIATQLDRDIALVLDRSGSMTRSAAGADLGWGGSGTPAPAGCRFLDLTDAVDAFLSELNATPQQELVSLSTFSTSSTLDLDLAADYTGIGDQLDDMASAYPGGWTAIGLGLEDGMQTLQNPAARPYAVKTIVVMTDGIHNTGINPEDVAEFIHENEGVTVHTVTFSDEADIIRMQLTAELGGGQHWHATDAASLINAFREIARNLPTLLTE